MSSANQKKALYFPKMRHVQNIHFIGIGGAGMCGIAEVLHHEGYNITGSDLVEGRSIEHLRAQGIMVFIGHDPIHIRDIDVVVRSSAIDPDNVELLAAQALHIPVIPRAAMLAELMRFRYGIAIAGTHGKTTTTSLISSILAAANLDPSFVIGGKLNSCGANAKHGDSAYFVAEADESDASFLFLKPMMAVVTNIDADHLGTYNNDFNKLRQTFVEFLHHLPFHGLAVLCVDDPELRCILATLERPYVSYGFADDAQYRAVSWVQQGLLSHFTVQRPHGQSALNISFPWPGRHNVQNALAAIAIASELEIAAEVIINALAVFQGVGRRFQILGTRDFEHGSATIVDDYGHHPNEIKATIEAARHVWPNKKLIHVFQPHRYTRTQALFNEFIAVLQLADQLLLFDIYSAGEQPIDGVTSQHLLKNIKNTISTACIVSATNLLAYLELSVTEDCIILMQGAGSISQTAYKLLSIQAD